MILRIHRWVLTAALLYGVYTETGKWTALALTLSAVTTELRDILAERQRLIESA